MAVWAVSASGGGCRRPLQTHGADASAACSAWVPDCSYGNDDREVGIFSTDPALACRGSVPPFLLGCAGGHKRVTAGVRRTVPVRARGPAGSLPGVPAKTYLPGVAELLEAAVEAVGGTRREGQDAMVRAVRKALTSGEHLAVQAGTGTGKSLAYLVPAIHHAVDEGPHRRRLHGHDRAAAPARRPRPAPPRQGPQAAARAGADVRDPQGPAQLPVPQQAARARRRRPGRRAVRPVRRSAMGRAVKRLHEWADTTDEGRPRRARPRRDRGDVAAGVGHRAGVRGRVEVPGRATTASPSWPRPRRVGPTSSSPTTRCSPSTRSRAARCCPSTTSSSSTRRTSWSTASPASPPRS